MLMNAIYVQASINRIRLEFKVKAKLTWTTRSAAVLIESDWNLKELHMDGQQVLGMVLIESDWNLKMALAGITIMIGGSINRIRLEFKGLKIYYRARTSQVLIESDWNLKHIKVSPYLSAYCPY